MVWLERSVTHSAATSVKEDLLCHLCWLKSQYVKVQVSTFHLSDRKSQGYKGGQTKVCYGSQQSWFDMFLSYRGDIGVLLRLQRIGFARMRGVIILDFQNIFTEVIQISPQ